MRPQNDTATHERHTMYEYRILFPRLGSKEIRRDFTARAAADERRRIDGCVRPEPRTRKERS
jgi:hypothetical protein